MLVRKSLPDREFILSQGPVVHWYLLCLLYHTHKIRVCWGTTLPYPQPLYHTQKIRVYRCCYGYYSTIPTRLGYTISYPPCKKGIRPGICVKPVVWYDWLNADTRPYPFFTRRITNLSSAPPPPPPPPPRTPPNILVLLTMGKFHNGT